MRFGTSNFSALALFQREKRISVMGREGEGEGDFGENMDKRDGGGAFNAAIWCRGARVGRRGSTVYSSLSLFSKAKIS